jgi:hypothetical protein
MPKCISCAVETQLSANNQPICIECESDPARRKRVEEAFDNVTESRPPEGLRLQECPHRSRLMDKYSAAIAEFSRAVNIVNARMGVMYKGDYERLRKKSGRKHVPSPRVSTASYLRISLMMAVI